MLFSKPCQYAILAMTYLAQQPAGRLTAIREVAESANVPLPFLAKIVGSLARSGLVLARRGPNGGVALALPPEEITVGDIVGAIDGPLERAGCVLGFPECGDANPCPVHDSWKRVRVELQQTMHDRKLSSLPRRSGTRRPAGKRKS